MKLEGGERLVLKILRDLQGDSTDYVDDARLASATKMIVEDVRDWLETLEGKNGKGVSDLVLGFLFSPFERGVSDLPRRLRIQFEGGHLSRDGQCEPVPNWPTNFSRSWHGSSRKPKTKSDIAPRSSGKEDSRKLETFQMEPCG